MSYHVEVKIGTLSEPWKWENLRGWGGLWMERSLTSLWTVEAELAGMRHWGPRKQKITWARNDVKFPSQNPKDPNKLAKSIIDYSRQTGMIQAPARALYQAGKGGRAQLGPGADALSKGQNSLRRAAARWEEELGRHSPTTSPSDTVAQNSAKRRKFEEGAGEQILQRKTNHRVDRVARMIGNCL